MLMSLRHRLTGLVLTLVLLAANLAGSVAAHAMPRLADPSRASFALAWGEADAGLCTTTGSTGKTVLTGTCMACQIAGAAVLLGPATALPPQPLGYSLQVVLPQQTAPALAARSLAHLVRAPPQA